MMFSVQGAHEGACDLVWIVSIEVDDAGIRLLGEIISKKHQGRSGAGIKKSLPDIRKLLGLCRKDPVHGNVLRIEQHAQENFAHVVQRLFDGRVAFHRAQHLLAIAATDVADHAGEQHFLAVVMVIDSAFGNLREFRDMVHADGVETLFQKCLVRRMDNGLLLLLAPAQRPAWIGIDLLGTIAFIRQCVLLQKTLHRAVYIKVSLKYTAQSSLLGRHVQPQLVIPEIRVSGKGSAPFCLAHPYL